MGELIPIVLFLTVAYTIVGVARIVSDGRTRRRLIEAGASSEVAEAVARATRDHSAADDSLKWGLVVGGVGLALVIVQFLPFRSDDPIALGLVLLFGAAGLLGHFALTRRSLPRGGEEARRVT